MDPAGRVTVHRRGVIVAEMSNCNFIEPGAVIHWWGDGRIASVMCGRRTRRLTAMVQRLGCNPYNPSRARHPVALNLTPRILE
jgi:hypothetical protein